MKRHFEFIGGPSAKFWKIIVAGCNVTVCFGRIGTQGQTQSKTFISSAAAHHHADRLIGEKIKKGYGEKVAA